MPAGQKAPFRALRAGQHDTEDLTSCSISQNKLVFWQLRWCSKVSKCSYSVQGRKSQFLQTSWDSGTLSFAKTWLFPGHSCRNERQSVSLKLVRWHFLVGNVTHWSSDTSVGLRALLVSQLALWVPTAVYKSQSTQSQDLRTLVKFLTSVALVHPLGLNRDQETKTHEVRTTATFLTYAGLLAFCHPEEMSLFPKYPSWKSEASFLTSAGL